MRVYFKNGFALKVDEPENSNYVLVVHNDNGRTAITVDSKNPSCGYYTRVICNSAEILFIDFENEQETGSKVILYDENGERR